MVKLSSQIRERRKQYGLTQIELAELAGVSDRFVRAVEQGKPSVQLDSLLNVTNVLGLSLKLEVREL